jgi:hypothetical protein
LLQSLVDQHGEAIIHELWDEITVGSDWEPLEKTLARYDETLPDAVVRYHIKNLVRDYELAPAFADYTVWQENVITHPGWNFRGRGSQELGANYYALALHDGSYSIRLVDDDQRNLDLWLVGITGDIAEAFKLAPDNIIDPNRFDYIYLVVFNPTYDDDLSECDYSSYRFRITPNTGENLPEPTYRFNAQNFAPPE